MNVKHQSCKDALITVEATIVPFRAQHKWIGREETSQASDQGRGAVGRTPVLPLPSVRM